jgi:hypothetical protein
MNVRKFFLYLLIGSVAFSALLGIGVILFGSFGDFESKILLTTFIIACGSILGLACGAFIEARGRKLLPLAGIGLSMLSAVWWVTFVWADFVDEDLLIKIGLTLTIFAVACSHISLLSIASLDRRFIWARYLTQAADWILSAILLSLVWIETTEISELVSRSIGVLSIVIASLTILTPIFHKLSGRPADEAEAIDEEIARLKARIAELEATRGEPASEG